MPVHGGSGVNSVGAVKGLKKQGDCNSYPLTHVNSVSCSINGNTLFRLRVVPLLLSLLFVMRKKTAKKWPREILGA